METTAPAFNAFEQVPVDETCPLAYLIVHLIPPRLEIRVPLAVLPLPLTLRVNLLTPAAPLAALTALSGPVGWSLQAWRDARATAKNRTAPVTSRRDEVRDIKPPQL